MDSHGRRCAARLGWNPEWTRVARGPAKGVYHMKTVQETPERAALKADEVAALLGVSRSQFWKLHSGGKVPLPVYLGAKAPRWIASELTEWLAAGAPDRLAWEKAKKGGK